MKSDNNMGGGDNRGPSHFFGCPSAPKLEPGLLSAIMAMNMKTETHQPSMDTGEYAPDTTNHRNFSNLHADMADTKTRQIDQGLKPLPDPQAHPLTRATEPGQILTSSPPFPRYMDYNEVATGTARNSGHTKPESGHVKIESQPKTASSLPKRPAPAKDIYPSRYSAAQGGVKSDAGKGTAEWMNSPAGQLYLARHKLKSSPTQMLSLECQKRKFNPSFEIDVVNDAQQFRCSVVVRNMTFISGAFHSGVGAKQDAALKALRVVSTWPIPPASPLFFVAQFSGKFSDGAVHNSLRHLLKGRKYSLSIQRSPRMSGGHLLLEIPDQGFPDDDIRLDGGLESVVFVSVKKGDHCTTCANTPHPVVKCPMWRTLQPYRYAATKNRQNEPAHSDRKQAVAQRPVKRESEEYSLPPARNQGAALAPRVENHDPYNHPVDEQAHLIRRIHEVMGRGAPSSESQDPRVKTAFLEGVALGARLAATAPGPAAGDTPGNALGHALGHAPGHATGGERRRSRSPDGRDRRPGYYHAPSYRVRSPPVRERQMSREPPMDRPFHGYGGLSRDPRWSPCFQPSHWDSGRNFR